MQSPSSLSPERGRADLAVVAQGLAPSRARAQALILAGAVVDATSGARVDKPGAQVLLAAPLRLKDQPLPYVSRGGLKLAGALQGFDLDVTGLRCLDVGASTGGFTDCLLQHGAAHVVAVDVGYGQLAWSLRQDPRVTVCERSNIRTLPDDALGAPCELMVVDVSFISLKLVLPAALRFMARPSRVVALVKPQFEVGRAAIGKGGLVRSAEAREQALADVRAAAEELGLTQVRTMASPITGAKGNHEYLLTAVSE